MLTDYSVYVIEEKAKTVLKTYPGIEPERLIRDMYEEIKGNTEKFADWAHGRNEDPEWYVLTLECYKAKIKSITDKELHIHKDGSQDVDREKFQDKFWEKFLDPAGFDGYGFFEKHDDPHVTDRGGYENDTFLINPYYWGDDEEIAGEPNFVYKPTGFEIRWYKYPMRGATANRAFTEEEFDQMLGECLTSMK